MNMVFNEISNIGHQTQAISRIKSTLLVNELRIRQRLQDLIPGGQTLNHGIICYLVKAPPRLIYNIEVVVKDRQTSRG